MGIIICQSCNSTIEVFENEKVSTLYSKCEDCGCNHKETKNID
ncbi:GapA-binding peptide SR1P [Ferdinandcohnia quinoae]|uniref:GapA-binding peptide SR1P n=1 Tax=Fredinandcohnia quinoae TaxID=2918902 RepID=A0AAW5DTG1_9BACI|nr:GapA-binding peptide SR1P [Fredinandcohnia sp. SECRCQ15]MCH1623940.1 GapA-binding peptide SR1P [Fredinandcohnia sp. SECRCQ15]